MAKVTNQNKAEILKQKVEAMPKATDPIYDLDWELIKKKPYLCCMCGERYGKQTGNFSVSKSPFFKGNNSYLPICRTCVEKATDKYTEELGDQEEAIRRIAMHWDLYVSESLLESSKKGNSTTKRINTYIRHCNLGQNAGKTYDTYLQETKIDTITSIDESDKLEKYNIPPKTAKFFGIGFAPEEYLTLQEQYDDWTTRHECVTKAQEQLFKNICIAQLNIEKATQGKINMKIDTAMEAFQKLLDSANLKPKQTNENTIADQNSFGTLIKKWEYDRPISEPLDEWKDVDGIVRYISVYFLGHLCKMIGIKNKYSKMYDDEMAKYKVDKPEYEDDDEALFDAIFSSTGEGDE